VAAVDLCPTCLRESLTDYQVESGRLVVEHRHCPECKDEWDEPDRPVSAVDDSADGYFHMAKLHQRCWDNHQQPKLTPEQRSPHLWRESEFRSLFD
jgi:hypothetical protein